MAVSPVTAPGHLVESEVDSMSLTRRTAFQPPNQRQTVENAKAPSELPRGKKYKATSNEADDENDLVSTAEDVATVTTSFGGYNY